VELFWDPSVTIAGMLFGGLYDEKVKTDSVVSWGHNDDDNDDNDDDDDNML